jgi:hypothetical protein
MSLIRRVIVVLFTYIKYLISYAKERKRLNKVLYPDIIPPPPLIPGPNTPPFTIISHPSEDQDPTK